MCSPKVAEVVRETIRREGRPQVSRRDFMRLSSVTAAGLAVVGAPSLARPKLQDMAMGNVVDLSHVLKLDTPMFPGAPAPEREVFVTIATGGYYGNVWTLWEHTATHVDIPAHFAEGGQTADQFEIG